MTKNYLARESLVPRWAAALLHLQGLGQATVVGHRNFHADVGNAGGAHLGGVGCSNQDIIQIGQNHHQVLTGGGHAIRTAPVFLRMQRFIAEIHICLSLYLVIHLNTYIFNGTLTSLKTTSNCFVSLLPCCLLCQGSRATRVMSLPWGGQYRPVSKDYTNGPFHQRKQRIIHEAILTMIWMSPSSRTVPLGPAT